MPRLCLIKRFCPRTKTSCSQFEIVGLLALLTGQSLPILQGVWSLRTSAEDLGEAVGEPVEASARSAVWHGTAEHLQHMLSGEQGIDDAVEAGTKAGDDALGCGARCRG